ncbi:MAG: DUF4197 domain-containing protein [Pseudomonadota bacterium]
MKVKFLLLTTVLLLPFAASADLKDKLKGLLNDDEKETTEQTADEPAAAPEDGLSSDQRASGIKEALEQGVKRAITTLGQRDGFWTSETVQIPLPDAVDRVAKTARKLGGDRYVEEFHETLNRAAEEAVPVATELFGEALSELTIEDAIALVRGPDDAATQYFREKTEGALAEQFLPIVTEATGRTGVTQAYKELNKKAGGFLSQLGQDEDDLDLDQYVTQKALDGLFAYVAEEERLIRSDPVARTTDLLKTLFQ